MNRTFFIKLGCLVFAGALILALAGCPSDDSGGGGGGGLTYVDTPVTSFAGTYWSDYLIPESTFEFTSSSSVTVSGRYFDKQALEINGAQKPVTGLSGVKTYEVAGDLSAAKVEPAVWVLTDTTNRKGFELYLYKADAAAGKHQRLVVYLNGTLQPREFYRLY